MWRKTRLITKIALVVLVAIIGAVCFIYFAPGYDIYMVRSESMKPAVKMGDMIITGPANNTSLDKLQAGTIITFQSGKALVTHRVVSINGDTVVTKGDAMEDPDPLPVSMSQIKGVYLFKIPYIGYLTYFIRTRMGWWLTIILPAAVLVGFIIKDILKETFRTEPQLITALTNQPPVVTKPSPPIATGKKQTLIEPRIEAEAARIVKEILVQIRTASKITEGQREGCMCS